MTRIGSHRCVDPVGETAILPFPSWPAPAVFAPLQQGSRHHEQRKGSARKQEPAEPKGQNSAEIVASAARSAGQRWQSSTPTRRASTSIPTCTWSVSRPIVIRPKRKVKQGLPDNVRRFGANSCDLAAIADWLAECGVTTVAMESTGVYWIPLFELLESRGFEVYLVEPGQLSPCGARPKTDVLDAQWIQRLHTYGLLRRRSGRPTGSWPCAATTGSGRCKFAMRRATSSTCKRPSSR